MFIWEGKHTGVLDALYKLILGIYIPVMWTLSFQLDMHLISVNVVQKFFFFSELSGK